MQKYALTDGQRKLPISGLIDIEDFTELFNMKPILNAQANEVSEWIKDCEDQIKYIDKKSKILRRKKFEGSKVLRRNLKQIYYKMHNTTDNYKMFSKCKFLKLS